MIDTKSLEEGDICLVDIERYESPSKNILCIFINGLFQDIEEKYTYEVYGSSVYSFKKIQTTSNLLKILSDKMKLLNSEVTQT